MKKVLSIFAAGLLFFAVSCKDDKKDDKASKAQEKKETVTPTPKEKPKIKLALQSKSNSKVTGNVVFVENEDTVKMTAIVSGLTPGTHAIHIHEKADCSSPDGKSSGGHWNPTAQPHGKWGDKEGYHKGDIGNFEADKQGNATITLETDQWCITCDDDTKNIIGKAIIVHQGADDFVSQPSGAAGSRVSCGGIIQ